MQQTKQANRNIGNKFSRRSMKLEKGNKAVRKMDQQKGQNNLGGVRLKLGRAKIHQNFIWKDRGKGGRKNKIQWQYTLSVHPSNKYSMLESLLTTEPLNIVNNNATEAIANKKNSNNSKPDSYSSESWKKMTSKEEPQKQRKTKKM